MKQWIIVLLILMAARAMTAVEAPPWTWAVANELPAWEIRVLLEVGQEYNLTGEEQKLLLTIRRIENGRLGLEMGIASNNPQHCARRYAQDPVRSLRIQAQWAAGTIRHRYTGNLEAFAQVYCPPERKHWLHMARYWMTRERK